MRKLQTLVTEIIYVEVQSVQYGNSGVLLEPFGGSTCIGWSGWLTKRSRDAYDLLKKKMGCYLGTGYLSMFGLTNSEPTSPLLGKNHLLEFIIE